MEVEFTDDEWRDLIKMLALIALTIALTFGLVKLMERI